MCYFQTSYSQTLIATLDETVTGDASGYRLGHDVDISTNGTRIVVGSNLDATGGTNKGSVKVYEYSGGSWSQLGSTLYGEAAEDQFGYSVGISGDGTRIIVGAPYNNGGGTDAGSVRVYEYSGSSWSQIGSDIDGSAGSEFFGYAVDLNQDGTRIIVGAYGASSNTGRVSIYSESGGTWTLMQNITGGTTSDKLGGAVAMNPAGDYVAVGAENESPTIISSKGLVKVYTYVDPTWSQVGSTIPGPVVGDFFSRDLSISDDGTKVAAGGWANDSNGRSSGIVQVFSYSASAWSQEGSNILGTSAGDKLGWALSLSGDGTLLVVGSKHDDGNGNDAGSIRFYKYLDSDWTLVSSDINGSAAGVELGYSLSLNSDGSWCVAGAPVATNGEAKVYKIDQKPIISNSLTASTATSMTLEGNITQQGTSAVSARGFVYSSTDTTPTIGEGGVTQVADGSGTGVFSEVISGLSHNTTYYASAYATNDTGTSYGSVITYEITNTFNVSTGNWSDSSKWSYGTVPSASDNITIDGGYTVTVDAANAFGANLTINPTSSLVLSSGNLLFLTGNLVQNGTMTISSGASLILSGTSTGTITYQRNLPTTNWYLISSPVAGQSVVDFVSANNLALGSGTGDAQNIGLALYDNTQALVSNRWNYYTVGQTNGTGGDDTSDVFSSGQGLAVKRATAGTISFTGTLLTDDISNIALSVNQTGYNFVGNPYPSFILLSSIFSSNDAGGNDLLSESTIWIWNQSLDSYTTYNQSSGLYIAPGQGFFVKASGAASSFTITKAMRAWQSSDTYHKQVNTYPKITLKASNGTSQKTTELYFITGTTTGFDNGYDSSLFESSSFEVYSQLLTDNQGQKLAIQSLPDSNYEEMVIPIGIQEAAGKTLTFTAIAQQIPESLHVYLEDRLLGVFTQLDTNGGQYEIAIPEEFNEVGRFYIHVKTSAVLSVDPEDVWAGMNIYNPRKGYVQIDGVYQKNTQVKMYSVLGKEVFATRFDGVGNNLIELENVRTGVYMIMLKSEKGHVVKKIIIN